MFPIQSILRQNYRPTLSTSSLQPLFAAKQSTKRLTPVEIRYTKPSPIELEQQYAETIQTCWENLPQSLKVHLQEKGLQRIWVGENYHDLIAVEPMMTQIQNPILRLNCQPTRLSPQEDLYFLFFPTTYEYDNPLNQKRISVTPDVNLLPIQFYQLVGKFVREVFYQTPEVLTSFITNLKKDFNKLDLSRISWVERTMIATILDNPDYAVEKFVAAILSPHLEPWSTTDRDRLKSRYDSVTKTNPQVTYIRDKKTRAFVSVDHELLMDSVRLLRFLFPKKLNAIREAMVQKGLLTPEMAYQA